MTIHPKGHSSARAKGGRSSGGTRYFQSKRRGEENLVKYFKIKNVITQPKILSPIEMLELAIKKTDKVICDLLRKHNIKSQETV